MRRVAASAVAQPRRRGEERGAPAVEETALLCHPEMSRDDGVVQDVAMAAVLTAVAVMRKGT